MRTMRKYIRENGNRHANREESTSYIGESLPLVFKKSSKVLRLGKYFPLKSTNVSVSSSWALSFASWTSILEAPHGEDFSYTNTTIDSIILQQ
jgi:hypothetical protein